MSDFIVIIISAAVVSHLFLEHGLGAEATENFSRRLDVAFHFGLVLLILIPLATGLAALGQQLLLMSNSTYLLLPMFVVIVFFLMSLLQQVSTCLPQALQQTFDVFLPVAGMNTAVFGAIILSLDATNTFITALVFGFGSASGFAISLVLLAGLRLRLEMLDIPAPLQGLPIILITAGVMSMAFLGFTGLV